MNIRRMWLLSFALIGLFLTTNDVNSGGSWSVWLFNQDSDSGGPLQFVRVSLVGQIEEHDVPLPEGAVLQTPVFAFTESGNWVAFCTVQNGSTQVMVIDLYAGVQGRAGRYELDSPLTIDLGAMIPCPLSAHSFDDSDDQHLALGVSYGAAGRQPLWEIQKHNLITGEIEGRLTADTIVGASRGAFIGDPTRPLIPLVRDVSAGNVTFNLLPDDSADSSPVWIGGYSWGIDDSFGVDDYVNRHTFYDHLQLDIMLMVSLEGTQSYISGAEYIWSAWDSMTPLPPGMTYNALIYSRNGTNPYPIFTHPNGLRNPLFINGGRHIAIDVPSEGLIALSRYGTTQALPVELGTEVVGSPSGYVFLETDTATQTTRLLHHIIDWDGSVGEHAMGWETVGNQRWSIIWRVPVHRTDDHDQEFPPAAP